MSAVPTKEVTLDTIVNLCLDCTKLCEERTQRFVEDVGLKPYGFGWQVERNAGNTRQQAMDKCLMACNRVKGVCPTADRVRQYRDVQAMKLAEAERNAAGGMYPTSASAPPAKGPWWKFGFGGDSKLAAGSAAASPVVFVDELPSPSEIHRCDRAAGELAGVLHGLANLPTRVDFEEKEGRQDAMMPTPKPSASRYATPAGMTPPPGWDKMSDEQQEMLEQQHASARKEKGSMVTRLKQMTYPDRY